MEHFAKNRFKTSLFHRMLKLANAISALPTKLTPPPFRLIQMGSAYWQSRALHLAAELDIATYLHEAPCTVSVLANTTAVNEDALKRLLRYLVSLGIFEMTDDGKVSNNNVSAYLDSHHPHCVRAMVLMHQSPPMTEAWWSGFGEGLRQGRPGFELSNGEPLFDYLSHHPDFNHLFAQAMTSVEALVGSSYAEDFDWSAFHRIIDVGGSNGSKAAAILQQHPQLSATVCDLPAVIEEAQKNPSPLITEAIAQRITFVPGDVFGEVPASGPHDVYLLSGVLHGFSDEQCVTILKNIRHHSGRCDPWLVIMEMVVEEPIDAAMAAFDMQMLVCTEGKERNRQEWLNVIQQSGYELVEQVATASFASLLVIRGSCKGETSH